MCAQCATTGAVVATTAATGARVYLAAKAPVWFTAGTRRWVSGAIVVGGVITAGVLA
jgi:hypothetical protein